MKKAVYLVALFLIGTATQTKANHQSIQYDNVSLLPNYNRGNTIQLVEGNVLFTITPDGAFTYQPLARSRSYKKKKRGSGLKRGHFKKAHRQIRPVQIITDRHGRIRSIDQTQISYNRIGGVRTIGNIALIYNRGRIVQVGAMQVLYNRYGTIRNTSGHINRHNESFWHEDWYTNIDHSDVNYQTPVGRRIRTE